ncbi:MAG: AMIN domain-containing protein, partial [Rickettsiales bacterium]|nr:AMIN domain-containing protein [Rickettsiales bacterium]
MFSGTYNPAYAQAPNIIIDTRYDLKNNRMRFVVESTKRPNYNIITLENPNRLVIDLKNTQKQKRRSIHFNSDILTKIRFGIRKKTDLRIVLDMKTQYMHRTFLLEPSASNKRGYRLVTDIF